MRIDVSYYDNGCDGWSEWALEAAIEVENDDGIWTEEVSKLLMLNSGLKVLIAYENDPATPLAILEAFPAIYRSRKYNNAANWLFIFGPRTLPATHDFSAYSFDGVKFTDITGGVTIIS